MLVSLHVRNLALVDELRVEFDRGLNVITGETGAGKSILVGALLLVLGERADKTLVRTGESACSAEALFHLQDPRGVDAVLGELGLDPCEDGQLILRRVVRTAGGNQNSINDCSVTMQALKRVGALLVDLHGPHDHQSLLHADAQLELLDAYGRHGKASATYQAAYTRLRDLEREREALQGSDEGVSAQIDLLSYRVKEIEEAALLEEEEATLLAEQGTLAHAQDIKVLGDTVIQALAEADSSALDAVGAAQRALEDLVPILPEAEAWRDELKGAAIQLQELHATVGSRVGGIEADPARLAWIDERLAVYDRMKRKYGGSVPEILARLEEARARLDDLSGRGERLAALEKEIVAAGDEVAKAGRSLRTRRKTAAGKLAGAVTAELRSLGFEHGSFDVQLASCEPRPSGIDTVEFGFAPNVGETMRPLRAIASSGEISRVMLATKVILAELDRIPVLAFDEVDANVGGEMGRVVGGMLARLASDHQVLCITHLPQTAIHGTHHLAVEKSVRDGRTYTGVRVLDGKERAEEIARMLGGVDFTRGTLSHAREMLASVG